MATLLGGFTARAKNFHFNYPNFTHNEPDIIMTSNASMHVNAIQVTMEPRGTSITNLSARAWYRRPFKIWRKNTTASFNSTFVINIKEEDEPGGEGLAFILTGKPEDLPENSHGRWLGVVNSTTNGTSQAQVVAVEFDTRKSYEEDLDNNHVGVDVNSVYSIRQVAGGGVNISSGRDVTAIIVYDGQSKNLSVFVFMTDGSGGSMDIPIISEPLILSDFLPEDVYLGFSASTGNGSELNCVKSWNFTGTVIDSSEAPLWIWIVIAVALVLLLSGVFLIFNHWKRKCKEIQVGNKDPQVELKIQSSATAPKKYRLRKLRQATRYFASKDILGRGGCGEVYKGILDGKEVAVKRFLKDSGQGKQDFLAEVTTIGNLHHRNLVKLLGWCYESGELLLVYEFMPNGSLDKFIFHSETNQGSALGWELRQGIVYGVAQALDYLHNGCDERVLHRDIKASNVMLDSEFNPRLGDFGLARTIRLGENTHHSTKEIAGTPGYMAPESFLDGRATAMTDIYSFGVLLLEVVCGRRPGAQSNENSYNNRIVDWVWEFHRLGRIVDVVDDRLREEFVPEQAERVLKLGLACCHPNPYWRPTMRTALQVLEGEATPPTVPDEKPAFIWPAVAPSFSADMESSATQGQITPITVLTGR
ncbi:Non-specific serine/threonine protein kinase [Bertholletia excelsa]